MNDLEIGGHQYRIGDLDVFKQFHVARKIAPLLPAFIKGRQEVAQAMLDQVAKLKPEGGEAPTAPAPSTDEPPELSVVSFATMMAPIADALSKLSDEDSEYVLKACLSACTRLQGKNWARLVINGNLMLQDIKLPDMLQLAYAVIQAKLESFFPGAQP